MFGFGKKKEKQQKENTEVIDLFIKLENLSKTQPEVFEFFLSKYGKIWLDSYDWSALWRVETQSSTIAQFLPYVGIFMNLIILIMVIRK